MDFISKYFNTNLAIDLGTANTLIYKRSGGIILNEPSVIAYEATEVIGVGFDAKKIEGKHPEELKTVRPLKDGVIAEFTAAEDMIQQFIKKTQTFRYLLNQVVCGVPTGITPVEQRAVIDAVEKCGAREVHLVAEPMAAAIGVGLDVLKPKASLIVDIGGGTTDIAVIAYGGIVVDNTIKIAGDDLTMAVIQYFKNEFNLLIGEATAEKIKIQYSTAVRTRGRKKRFQVKGLDYVMGLPKIIKVSENDIYKALEPIILKIISAVKGLLESTPPELISDLLEYGIVLTGGGAMIKGLDQKISKETNLPVHIAEESLLCVVNGAKKIIENLSMYSKVLIR